MKVTTKWWLLLTVVLLFSLVAVPLQVSADGPDEPDQMGRIDNRPRSRH